MLVSKRNLRVPRITGIFEPELYELLLFEKHCVNAWNNID